MTTRVERVVFTVSKDGNVVMEQDGFIGGSCLELNSDITGRAGVTVHQTHDTDLPDDGAYIPAFVSDGE